MIDPHDPHQFDAHDPHKVDEARRRVGAPFSPDTNGNDMARSFIVLGIIVVLVLGGLWLAGA